MFVMILKDGSRHQVTTEPRLDGKVWVATDANGMKIKVSESQLDRYIQTDDPTETFFHVR
jgi:hypothetical protein